MEGLQPQQVWRQQPPAGPAQNGLAIAGLICSISSLTLLFLVAIFTFGFSMLLSGPLAIAGLVCGLVGRQKVDSGEFTTGRSMGQAAFVMGIVSLALHVLAVVIGVVLLGILLESIGDIDIPEPDKPPQETVPSI